LDISQKLIEKFGLKEKGTHSFFAYINKDLLKKTPEEGGITVDNEKDILLQTEGIILFQEKEIQVDFTSGEITDLKQKLKKSEELSQETQKLLEIIVKDNEEKHIAIIFFETQIKDLTQRITELRRDLENEILNKKREESKNQELERIIRKLREDEQVLIGLQNNFTQLQTELGNQVITLTTEKDRIQGELDNLQTRLCRLQGRFLGSFFRSKKKSEEIKELKVQRARLRDKLIEKNQQINDLGNTINTRNQTIANLNTQIATLNSQKLTPEEQNAISYIQTVLSGALIPAVSQQNIAPLNSYRYYVNAGGVIYTDKHYTYGRLSQDVVYVYNL
jgi:DNA repair exonuclease SbcCD ATPase subunit